MCITLKWKFAPAHSSPLPLLCTHHRYCAQEGKEEPPAIICQKDDWYKADICYEWSIRVLSPSQNDNYWYLRCGCKEESDHGSEQHCTTRSLPKRHAMKPEGDRTHSASWETLEQSWCCFPATQFAQTSSVSIKNVKNLLLQKDFKNPTMLQYNTGHFLLFIGL